MNNYSKMKVEELRKAIDIYNEQKKDLVKGLQKLERAYTSLEIEIEGYERKIETLEKFISDLEERIEKYAK